jgi:hypothetical protein
MWPTFVSLAITAAFLFAWLSITGWRGFIDPLSSLGILVIAAIIGIVYLAGRLQDWRWLYALRRHLSKRRAARPRQPKSK